ncbi:MAG TPA: cation diffusion facilitator family transporter [Mariprofundaceae bacterium]|nr:cation diffusion facilitator family transporter [Mariprofundaceae bacterium]
MHEKTHEHAVHAHEGHSHDHGHHHAHHHGLNGALALTTVFALVELVGGLMANSLALLADAGHMVSDVAALSLAVMAGRIASRPAHAGMSYGYGRARVLAAQANGLGLWFLAGWISWEAFGRLSAPPVVNGGIVLGIAAIGLLINLAAMFMLRHQHDLNTKAAYWHVLGDAMGSVAAMIAGAVILTTGWNPIDPLLSFLVAGILAWGGWRLLRETTLQLMDSVPDAVEIKEVSQAMLALEHVAGVHHIHIWTLPNGTLAMSAHVQLNDMLHWPELLPAIQNRLAELGITHATLQPELSCCD